MKMKRTLRWRPSLVHMILIGRSWSRLIRLIVTAISINWKQSPRVPSGVFDAENVLSLVT